MYKRIFILADIEGSTGCGSYAASSFNTPEWYSACIDMSLDINAVVSVLFEAGAERVYVKDFHRTGYNLLPELIDKRAEIIHGYKTGPVPGIGDLYDSECAMFIGMHSSSGSDGFLAHTFTSRYSGIKLNGRSISELQLFSSSMYRYSVKPVFFSGCPVACREAAEQVKGIEVFPVIKDNTGRADRDLCRKGLAEAAAGSLYNNSAEPYMLQAPFTAELTMRDGEQAAEKISRRWGLDRSGESLYFTTESFDEFYSKLISITYLTPLLERITPAALSLFNLYGRAGLSIVRMNKRAAIKSLSPQPRSNQRPC